MLRQVVRPLANCREGTLDTAAVQTHVGNPTRFLSVLTVSTPDITYVRVSDAPALYPDLRLETTTAPTTTGSAIRSPATEYPCRAKGGRCQQILNPSMPTDEVGLIGHQALGDTA
jgi:hypothetical protein